MLLFLSSPVIISALKAVGRAFRVHRGRVGRQETQLLIRVLPADARALSQPLFPSHKPPNPEPIFFRKRIGGLSSFRSDGLARSAGRGDLPALGVLERVNI